MKYPLTTQQRNIWNLIRTYNSSIANISGIIIFNSVLDTDKLAEAINLFVKSQEGIRIRISEEGKNIFQIPEDYCHFDVPVYQFDSLSDATRFFTQEGRVPFKSTDRLYRFCIFTAEGHTGVFPCCSHLVADAWSLSLFCNSIIENYIKLANDDEIEPACFSYLEYAEKESEYILSQRFSRDKEYWETRFSEKPQLSFIVPERKDSFDGKSERFTSVLERDVSERIYNCCSENGISPAILFEAATLIYLHNINDSCDENIIGVPVLNRTTRREKQVAGMFISTVPLGIKINDNETALDLFKDISSAHSAIFRHQQYPYSDILRYIRDKHNFSGNLFDVVVSFQNAKITVPCEYECHTRWLHNGFGEIPLAIHIDDRDDIGRFTLNFDYQTAVFSKEHIKLLFDRIIYIIAQIVSNSDIQVDNIRIIPDEEYNRLIYTFNETDADYPREKSVQEVFAEQVKKTPDKTALVYEGEEFTYRRLDEMSNSLARYLREESGIKPNDIVPLISARSWHVIVGMLGIMKAGGAYMPIDPTYPKDRIAYMIGEAGSSVALTYGYSGSLDIDTVDLGKFDFYRSPEPIENVNSPDDTCYVIFTSGSSGKPKGTLIKHRGLNNFSSKNNVFFKAIFEDCERVLSIGSFTFDISVGEIFQPILNGAGSVIADESSLNSADEMADVITDNEIDLIHITPSRLKYYLTNERFRKSLSRVKTILSAGEAFSASMFTEIRKCSKAKVFNGYGPTEATIGSTFAEIQNAEDIVIGKPMSNVQIYILNSHGEVCPVGVPGELCISGDGVGKGYLNRPELTAEKFVSDPFREGQTMYKSGDLARWREDGELEYLGRIDTQVKIRGLRIELGEIESVMSAFDGISMSAVADKKDASGRQYLVGYYTSADEIDEKLLREHLSTKLPRYMIPNYFMRLSEIPMTSSGKTDRKSLPEPAFDNSEKERVEPKTQTEAVLVQIWEDILRLDSVSCSDDFFEVGGDSLTAITMLVEIEDKLGIHAEMKHILEHTVLDDLAECLDGLSSKALHIPKKNLQKYILTPQQKAIYIACSKDPNSLVYNMPMFISLAEGTDTEALKMRITEVYDLHPSLKTAIKLEGGDVIGCIDDRAELKFEEQVDMASFVRPFDLGTAPLMRAAFIDGGLAIDMHHIISDGDSMEIILSAIFGGDLREESVSYADYADDFTERLESGKMSEHIEYFRKTTDASAQPPELPEIPSSYVGGKTLEHVIDSDIACRVKEYAKKNNMTDTGVYFSAFGLLISKYSNMEKFMTSIILSNRGYHETADTVGMFVNTIPYSFEVDPAATWNEYAACVGKRLTDIYQYQELPFLEICDAVGITNKSIINSSFIYQPGELKAEGLNISSYDTHTCKMDISFQVIPQQNGNVRILVEYNGSKYDDKFIHAFEKSYIRILEQINADKKLNTFDVIGEEEYRKVVYTFNETDADYPREKSVQEVFAEQVKKTPDKTALVYEGEEFTYRRLDEMSNSLARYLREEAGIKPNDIVPLISARSWYVVVGMLGIMKAGGAYMPIDPTYPKDRIAYMIGEAGSSVALTYGYSGSLDIDTVDLGKFDFYRSPEPIENVNSPDDTCYVIFTSGSSGKPKGTLIKHRGLNNFSSKNNVFFKAIFEDCERVLSIGSFTFDISVGEIFQPILNGAGSVIADESSLNSADEMADVITDNEIDLIHITPSRLKYYLTNERFRKSLSRVKTILSAGEAFSASMFTEIRKCSKAKVFNGYGPTEATIGSTFAEIQNAEDIVIGKPMSNVQIYILNSHGEVCPVGVPGELCISGDGVGKGYLNRPELTAEKFVSDPFREGQTMYKSGDLARWREDGELEYLGRIDTQVKIRGLRIELGEIESVMSAFDGISMSAVADKKDASGRQYLVGYYTSADEIDEKLLREHLSTKLPRYMIPNYFMRLSEIPMTSSGKTNRKNLPEPARETQTEAYRAPSTDTEKKICAAMREVFDGNEVSVNDNFFEIGGDSLSAVYLVSLLLDKGITINVQDIYEHPVPTELGAFIDNKTAQKLESGSNEFVLEYKALDLNKADVPYTLLYKTMGNVLITGSTGFLGSHLLDEIFEREKGKIYCLVRNVEKLKQTLTYYFGQKYDAEIGGRIIPIVGDITEKDSLASLPFDVDTVIHSAANVKHYGNYSDFAQVNVAGTENMLEYACSIKAKFVFVSTTSVGGGVLERNGKGSVSFSESDIYIGQDLRNVYIRSKFEAEKLVLGKITEVLSRIFRKIV